MLDELFEVLGKLVLVGGGGAVLVYQVFKFLAAKWLEEKFKKNFQQLVHDQNKEIERLKTELTKSFDRAAKLHQREFEALPQVWDKVSEAYWAAASLVSPIQMHSDLNRMLPEQLKAFVDQSELAEWEKDEVLTSSDKTKKFQGLIYWYKLSRCFTAIRDASISLSRIGIFVQDPIKNKLQTILDLAHSALVEDQINHEHPPLNFTDRLKDAIDRMRSDGKTWMQEAEALIKARLWEN